MSNHSEHIDEKMHEMFRNALEPKDRPGATGRFPEGKLTPKDEGQLQLAVATVDGGKVVVDFGKPVAWLGLTASDARGLAELLVKHADKIDNTRLPRTEVELSMVLAGELSKVIGSNIALDGLQSRPTALQTNDVLLNVHLFDRLGAAYEALRALRPQYGKHPGFAKVDGHKNEKP